MYIPNPELLVLFASPLVVGFGYVKHISEVELKVAYSYMIGIFMPSALYFFIWLIAGLQFNLADWAIINIIVFTVGIAYRFSDKVKLKEEMPVQSTSVQAKV